MESDQKIESGVHVNIKKDNGKNLYRYTCKLDKKFCSGASYAGSDQIVDDIVRVLEEAPSGSHVVLSSAHKIMSDRHKHESFLTAEQLEEIADGISSKRSDIKIILKPVGITYFDNIDSPVS